MKKALLLGEYKIARFLPVLRENGYTDIVVYSAIEFDAASEFDDEGVEVRLMDLDWTADDVVAVLEAERPDVAIANAYPHGQEQLPIAYGHAAARWSGRFVAHSARFAEIACDKVSLHRTAVERGWPVPAGAVCENAQQVAAAADEVGFPLVIKEARSQAGDGRFHAASQEELDGVLAAGLAFPAIVQTFARGVETGIELISADGALMRWPVVSMGPLDDGLEPTLRARVAPYELPAGASARLDEFVTDLRENFAPFGPWQIDFAVVDDGDDIVVLEINPRFGGLTDLALAGTGTAPHAVFTAAALGEPLPRVESRAVTLELPCTEIPGVTVPAHPEGAEVMEVTARRPTNRCFTNTDRMQLITTVGDPEAGKRWIKEVDAAGLLRCSVESAFRQLDGAFEVFGRKDGAR
ncbi:MULTISPECIES: ATP-grasp domain-containing protein [unclassified Streptomyces]|uniref:ATP-binding protein n=1 Tax=unclassified Streptomyces TaxID=2593676 RepID=UPI0015870EC0|nr:MULTISPECIES: ATP-grasp domain-containing protein [unclassified Streptomyces]NUV69286.1 ATP-grasp domain-containing protein [Streptomyces sp. CAI-121]NUW00930.1 ATP-grasp domain-containing protein [Streptomyces sp. CAI 127]NUW15429.1 ATP-grasp domain-containing protein [Streptomyces sp. CAI-68]